LGYKEVRGMKPVFKIESNDYTAWVMELEGARNDLDSDGAGRNLLDGLMYRARIAQKDKWTVKFLRLPETVMRSIAQDIDGEYAQITYLNPKNNRIMTKTFYCSTLNYGVQRWVRNGNTTVYDGVSFDITER